MADQVKSGETSDGIKQEAPLPLPCLVGELYDITERIICWWLINHFYEMGPESYRIRRNNAK